MVFISAFPSLRTVMMEKIDGFNELRRKNKSPSGDIDKTMLEKNLSIPTSYFTRREKWVVLLEWFIRLKGDRKVLKQLKQSEEKLFTFRKYLFYEFQRSGSSLKISDEDFPDKISSILIDTWDFVTYEMVKRIAKLLTFDELKGVFCSIAELNILSRACLRAVEESLNS